MKVTKNTLAREIYESSLMKLEEVKRFVDDFFNECEAELINKQSLHLKNFGKFVVQNKRARTGRNPKTGEIFQIPALRRVSFLSTPGFRNRLNSDTLLSVYGCTAITRALSGKYKNIYRERHVRRAVQSIIREIATSPHGAEIRGFGSFSIREYSSHIGRNPKTGESVQVPARKIPFFKAGKRLREAVK